MSQCQVDIAIIGAGSAGMRAYIEATKYSTDVMLIEGKQYGTTCARVGCMPSKLLIAAAEAAYAGEHAHLFGINYNNRYIDGVAVMARVRAERDRFVGFVLETIDKWPSQSKIGGCVTFVDDNTLLIDGKNTLKANKIIIACGSRSHIIPEHQQLGDQVIVSDDVFDWQTLPQSVAVFGAGVVGLELSQALSRLGVRVRLFGRHHHVGPLTDPDVIQSALVIFGQRYSFSPDPEVTRQEIIDGHVNIEFNEGTQHYHEKFDFLLAATGHQSNVDQLALNNTTLKCDAQGIPLYDLRSGQVADHPIFIAGDANNRLPLLHEATDEGAVAGFNAAHYPEVKHFKKSVPITIVFTSPQIMLVGASYQQLNKTDIAFCCGSIDWSEQGRARVMGINEGLLRVYGEKKTGLLLGAEMIGPGAEHIAHLLAWAIQSTLTVSQCLEMPFYHPVIEEGVRTALRELNFALQMGKKPPARCIDCGPGS